MTLRLKQTWTTHKRRGRKTGLGSWRGNSRPGYGLTGVTRVAVQTFAEPSLDKGDRLHTLSVNNAEPQPGGAASRSCLLHSLCYGILVQKQWSSKNRTHEVVLRTVTSAPRKKLQRPHKARDKWQQFRVTGFPCNCGDDYD